MQIVQVKSEKQKAISWFIILNKESYVYVAMFSDHTCPAACTCCVCCRSTQKCICVWEGRWHFYQIIDQKFWIWMPFEIISRSWRTSSSFTLYFEFGFIIWHFPIFVLWILKMSDKSLGNATQKISFVNKRYTYTIKQRNMQPIVTAVTNLRL